MQPRTRAGEATPRLHPVRVAPATASLRRWLAGAAHRGAARAWASTAVLALATSVLLGCGSGGADSSFVSPPISLPAPSNSAGVRLASPSCARVYTTALGSIARRVYHEIAGGRIALPAAKRLASAASVRTAAEAHDPAAAAAAIGPLLRKQLVRVRIVVGGHTLAEYGTHNAVAPVSTPLRDRAGAEIGEVIASEQGVNGYAATIRAVTGAGVSVRSGESPLGGATRVRLAHIPSGGEATYDGARYAIYSFPGSGFPTARLRTYLLAPVPPASACGASDAQTTANALVASAMRIYHEERSGAATRAAVAAFERSRPFQAAVASDEPVAARAAIVAFFKTTLHVVRVRAMLGSRLVADVGGPHVLAPSSGAVRDAQGRVVGRFFLSVQDDLGYMILAHRFTGADVLMRQGGKQLAGDLAPGPSRVPTRGAITYEGVRYLAYSFIVQAFPTGPLRVSLLIAQPG